MREVECPHIETFLSSENYDDDGTNKLDKLFSVISDLNKILNGQKVIYENGYSTHDTNDIRIDLDKLSECKECLKSAYLKNHTTMTSRLFICATCLYIGCFQPFNNNNNNDLNNETNSSHINSHSIQFNHNLSIDIVYGYVYCFTCKDFKYNEKFETCLKNCYDKIKLFPFGKFTEWEPSQNMLKILNHLTDYSSVHDGFSLMKSFKLKNTSIIGLRGLINLGNTCFMNCILQALTHTPSLRDYFLSDQHICKSFKSNNNNCNSLLFQTNSKNNNFGYSNQTNKNVCLVCEIVNLFQEFYSGKRSPHIPFNLLHQVWTQVKHLAGYEQQDAHEFFIAAINVIHKNCIENDLKCIELNQNQTNSSNYNNCNCIIDKIFTGGLQSDVICSHCGYISTTVDPFWDISLDIYNKNSKSEIKTDPSEPLKLEDCLLNFTFPEILNSFSCSNCKCSREAKKQLTMKNLPVVCCFHLKRFEQSNRMHKKISDYILFPEILDMKPYLSSTKNQTYLNKNEDEDNKQFDINDDFDSQKYFLFAVINHQGTIESGHYTSFIRLKNDQWYKCDDHIISRSSIDKVIKSEGYLLFYHKIWHNYTSN